MRLGTVPSPRFDVRPDLAIAAGIAAMAARTILITDLYAGGGPIHARSRDDETRALRTTPVKIKNNDTSRKPKERTRWPMLH
ncbi:hypothetical protein ASD45_21090 [Pseudolabrys sp. Root1462]|nr:hypothetical protein ASD45_21090 [Pseudolabrys sp. Root1462]